MRSRKTRNKIITIRVSSTLHGVEGDELLNLWLVAHDGIAIDAATMKSMAERFGTTRLSTAVGVLSSQLKRESGLWRGLIPREPG